VDDVLIDAPYVITEEMIQSLRISVVVTGSVDVHAKRRHLLGWGSDTDGSDSEEPSFNGVNRGPPMVVTDRVTTRGEFELNFYAVDDASVS
jgi:hypothetical protein